MPSVFPTSPCATTHCLLLDSHRIPLPILALQFTQSSFWNPVTPCLVHCFRTRSASSLLSLSVFFRGRGRPDPLQWSRRHRKDRGQDYRAFSCSKSQSGRYMLMCGPLRKAQLLREAAEQAFRSVRSGGRCRSGVLQRRRYNVRVSSLRTATAKPHTYRRYATCSDCFRGLAA